MLTFPELERGGAETRPQVLRFPACPFPNTGSSSAANHPRSLLKTKMTEGKVCEDAPKPKDSWGENRKTVCFVSRNFIWLDWFPLRMRCFFHFKTKKINEQLLYIGKGQEVRAPGEWNPTQRNELS